MDLCFVNVEKLKLVKRRNTLKIKFLSVDINSRYFLVNDVHIATVVHDPKYMTTIDDDIDFLRVLIHNAIKEGKSWTKKL
jgi:hypothetical protein